MLWAATLPLNPFTTLDWSQYLFDFFQHFFSHFLDDSLLYKYISKVGVGSIAFCENC